MAIDFAHVVGFDWDQGNRRKSADKHGVNQSEAEEMFFGVRLLVSGDEAHSAGEPRYHALGSTGGGRRLHVTFTPREHGTKIRVISARGMSRKERMRYESES